MNSHVTTLIFFFAMYSLLVQSSLLASCSADFTSPHPSAQNINEQRERVTQFLKENQIPGLLKQTNRGASLPVALVNMDTIDRLSELLDQSFGIIHQMQPKWGTDHGLVRIGNTLIDADEPSKRWFGEIHNTGLSWFEIKENTRRKLDNPETRIEIAYLLSPQEKADVLFYHKSRRAGIFVVRSSFNKVVNYDLLPNVFQSGSEHCFTFSKGSCALQNALEAERQIARMIYEQSAEAFLAKPGIRKFLELARKAIVEAPVTFDTQKDALILKPNFIADLSYEGKPLTTLVASELTVNLDERQILILSNWIIAASASQAYADLRQTLGISEMIGTHDIEGPRVSFVLIHEPTQEGAASFKNGSYSSQGRQASWNAHNQRVID